MVPDDQKQAALSAEGASASRHDVSWLQRRRSVAVKRLGPPAPTENEVREMLSAALSAPDHGALRPWRLVLCTPESRGRLADVFVAAKLARYPDATAIELEREREKAVRPPVLLALIAAPKPRIEKIPEIEQIASAGAAMQSILLAAYGLGYGDHAEWQPLRRRECSSRPWRRAWGGAARFHQHRHDRRHAKTGIPAEPVGCA